jgi:hypothetical protein
MADDVTTTTPDEVSPITPDELSLQEMLRVMDVARTLRKERETVAREFNRDETRLVLRERMLKTTAITGEKLTEAEVDAALELYFDNLHTFTPPPPGLSTFLAHAWVRRRILGWTLAWLAALGLLAWWLWPRPIDPRSEVYEVRIVTGEQQSGVERYFTDEAGTRQPAHYVVVQAVAPDGEILPRRIRNSETGRTHTVSTWAERVPAVVFERIKQDKQSDGVLDETLFAVKQEGTDDLEVVLPGEDGRPIQRGGQITDW